MKPILTDEERKLRKLAAQAKYRKTHAEKLKKDRQAWFAANPTYNSSYYEANKEKIKSATAKYAKERPEQTRAYKKAWEAANPEKVRAFRAAWQAANPEKMRAYQAAHYQRNKEKYAAADAIYRLLNRGLRAALQAKRKAAQRRATPAWAKLDLIKEIYKQASAAGMEVDHIIPLQGKLVCGLHVENNLQFLTKSENSRKKNSYSPE